MNAKPHPLPVVDPPAKEELRARDERLRAQAKLLIDQSMRAITRAGGTAEERDAAAIDPVRRT